MTQTQIALWHFVVCTFIKKYAACCKEITGCRVESENPTLTFEINLSRQKHTIEITDDGINILEDSYTTTAKERKIDIANPNSLQQIIRFIESKVLTTKGKMRRNKISRVNLRLAKTLYEQLCFKFYYDFTIRAESVAFNFYHPARPAEIYYNARRAKDNDRFNSRGWSIQIESNNSFEIFHKTVRGYCSTIDYVAKSQKDHHYIIGHLNKILDEYSEMPNDAAVLFLR